MCARKSSINISEDSEGFLFSETGFLSFTPDGKHLYAVSDSGLVYKYEYNSSNGSINEMSECANHQLGLNEKIGIISIANSGEIAVTSSKNELVQLYSMNPETNKLDAPKLVTKCPGAIDSLAINPAGTIVACSGRDNIVKIINVRDKSFPILNQIPSTHFVKAISFNESGNLLALLQVDGMLKIFKIIENEPAPQLYKTFIGPKSDINGKFQISWKNTSLSVLYGSKILRIYETATWTIKAEFFENEMQFVQLISNEAAFVANSEKISIYSIAANQLIASSTCENIESSSFAAFGDCSAFIFDPSKCDLFSIKFEIDADDLKVKEPSALKKKKTSIANGNSYISDRAEVEGDQSEDEEKEEMSDIGESEKEDETENELDGEDDGFGSNDEQDGSDHEEDQSKNYFERELHPVVPTCCTPWRNLQRYLAYNNVGFITCRRQLDVSSSSEIEATVYNYDIEFTDRSVHQPVRFSEEIAYSLASLHDKGAVFASQGVGACLHFVSFESSTESWTLPLPLGTEPILIGINSNSIYCVNSRGIMNIYTLNGLLRSSSTCPGRPISLCCNEKEVYLFISDSEGVSMFKLDSLNGGVIRSSQSSRVVLGVEERLIWCGVSYTGLLGAFLSSGMFLLHFTQGTDRWTEILDTSKTLGEKLEVAWPIYFDATSVSACVCKASDSGYPDPYPAPHVIDFAFRIPEISNDSFSNSYEEVLRNNWILNEAGTFGDEGPTERERKKLFAASDRHLLELAQLSIKANKFGRLSDLAQWSSNERTIDLLIQLAQHHKLVAVVDDIECIKLDLFSTKALLPEIVTSSNLTPKLPEVVAKESPSGILANLTPLKMSTLSSSISLSDLVVSSNVASSPGGEDGTVSSPSIQANPFAKASSGNENVEPEGNAMLDYISAMMKINGGNKRKADSSAAGGVKKSTMN